MFFIYSLLICIQRYKDLDEILARFVQPMAAIAWVLMTNPFSKTKEKEAYKGDLKCVAAVNLPAISDLHGEVT